MSTRPVARPSCYVVELDTTDVVWRELDALLGRIRAAAASRGAGDQVRFVRSVYVPEDARCFLLYEGPSGDAVRRAAEAANVGVIRIEPAIRLGEEE
ncbi:MAG: DUF4242 domain-containing protein [Chloroflexi bacterium]|jgi:hypothetical protein|nr:DUF4242 domain-containing protein [Chloroflexota bacterium]